MCMIQHLRQQQQQPTGANSPLLLPTNDGIDRSNPLCQNMLFTIKDFTIYKSNYDTNFILNQIQCHIIVISVLGVDLLVDLGILLENYVFVSKMPQQFLPGQQNSSGNRFWSLKNILFSLTAFKLQTVSKIVYWKKDYIKFICEVFSTQFHIINTRI
jgi:hypothetical protein